MTSDSIRTRARHPWWTGLQFQLVAVACLLLVALVCAAVWLSEELVGSGLVAEAEDAARARAAATATGLTRQLSDAARISEPLAVAVQNGRPASEPLAALGQGLLERAYRRTNGLVVGLGLWPAAGVLTPGRERDGYHWIASDAGIARRDDFNQPDRITYQQELWFTLARYARPGQCAWTGRRTDLLLQRPVVTCVQPLGQGERFAGAVTVDYAVSRLGDMLQSALATNRGYALLVDASGRLLAATDAIDTLTTGAANLAELSQQAPGLSPLALAIHRAEEARVRQSIDLDRYQATDVSALRDATRDLGRAESESLLAVQWTRDQVATDWQRLALPKDPELGADSIARFAPLGTTGWRLIVAESASQELAGANYIVTQTLVVTVGLVIIAMVLLIGLIRLRVLNPMRRIVAALQRTDSLEDALSVSLDESDRNEVGELAAWLNQRSRLLGEIAQQAQAVNTQLVLEVGERKSAVENLAITRERAEMTLKCIADGVITTNREGEIDYLNPVAETLVGRSNQEVRGWSITRVLKLTHANGTAYDEDIVDRALVGGQRLRLADMVLQDASGNRQGVALTIAPVRGRGSEVLGAVVAIHERNESGPTEVKQSVDLSRDALTGLFSRSAFDDDISGLIEEQATEGGRHAVMLIDIDQMRRINAAHGEQAGSELLRHLAHLFTGEISRAGRVYRLGGDKLLVLLRDATLDAAEAQAEVLRRAANRNPFRWEGQNVAAEFSIGLVKVDPGAGTSMELLRRAESAVQSAKAVGGNVIRRYRVEERQTDASNSDAVWVDRLRTGLDQGLFHLMSQTIAPLAHGLASGVEVHVSLEDEEGFWAAPSAFMPAAVRAGLASEIDRYVLHQLLEHVSDQAALDGDQFFAINLSTASLRDPKFLDFVLQEFDAAALPASRVCFEIDESAAIRHRVETHELLSALRPIGCRFVLDNFHSGMDGAELLKALRFDFVKLDQSLSHRAAGERVDRVALEAVIRVLRELKAKVIAGKVDNPAARTPLTELGVDYIQGFIVGRPAPLLFELQTQQAASQSTGTHS